MRSRTAGFSTLGFAVFLLAVTLIIGSVYVMMGKAQVALSEKKQVIYPTKKPTEQKKTEPKIAMAGGCELMAKNPNLSKRYQNTDAVTCGSLPAGSSSVVAAQAIQSCIQSALDSCKITKSYVYVQGFEGSLEYLISTNNCEIFVERWGTMEPYCGSTIDSCSTLSQNFPNEVCGDGLENVQAIPTTKPKQAALPQIVEEADGINATSCVTENDCKGKVQCLDETDSCSTYPACVNNACICMQICQQ